jgi:hypothetical protein
MRRSWILLPLLAACQTFTVQRAARVPHAAVPLRTGNPLDGPVEASVGLSNAGDPIAPTVGNRAAAVEVPGVQTRDELRFRVNQRSELTLIAEAGLGNYLQPDKTQAPVGRGVPMGMGGAIRHSFATDDPRWSIGVTAEAMVWSVPWIQYSTCVQDCLGQPFTVVEQGDSTVESFGFGVTPSYRSGPWTVFGGAYARSHPTIERKGLTYDTTGYPESGPINLLLHAGVEYAIDQHFAALVLVHQDVIADPVQYGPSLGLAISAH